jgi:hypothetical protein
VPPVAVGARADGDSPPQTPKSGIYFTNDKGESRFLQMGYPELPTQQDLKAMRQSDVVNLFYRAGY